MPHEVQSSIPAHKSRTPKVEGVSKLPGARVTGAASRGRRLTWQRCGMGQRTHAAAWLFQWWERVPGRRINGSGPERAPCRWATPEHEQERDAGLQALSHWWLRETYCRILCQAPVKQVVCSPARARCFPPARASRAPSVSCASAPHLCSFSPPAPCCSPSCASLPRMAWPLCSLLRTVLCVLLLSCSFPRIGSP